MSLMRFVLKSTVAGGFVYFTVQEGLWSKPEDSAELYKRVYSKIAPRLKENVPKEVKNQVPELPSTTDISDLARTSWNKGVLVSIKFITQIPTHTKNGFNGILEIPAIKNALAGVKRNSETDKSQ